MAKKTEQQSTMKCECDGSCCGKYTTPKSSSGAVYGMGMIGAAIYFFPQAHSIGMYLMAAFQSVVWPATLVYHAMTLLKIGL